MNEDMNKSDYTLISKYRTVLMGVSIIFILFCHVGLGYEQNNIEPTLFSKISHIMTVGVDLFLCLSGFGLYYSYTNRVQTYSEFEKKRLVRVLPCYLAIAGSAYYLYDVILKGFGTKKFLRDLFFVSWFCEGSTLYWYILAIIVFYLLFPVLYHFIYSGKNSFHNIVIFSMCWWVLEEVLCRSVSSFTALRIALARLPVFMIGIYLGGLSYEKKKAKRSTVIILLSSGPILLWLLKKVFREKTADYLHYPVRAILSISVLIMVIIIMEFLYKNSLKPYNLLNNILEWLGAMTLELYLLHQSYMILFENPYKFYEYILVAAILPLTTSWLIWFIKKKVKIKVV